MEHLQKQPEEKLKDLSDTIEQIAAAKEETRIQRATRLAQNVAKAAKELDTCVEKVGEFFEDLLESDLQEEKLSEELTNNGYPEPSDHPLGIPNTLTQEAYDKFNIASHSIITSKDCELRERAMFVLSLCNSLMFERRLLEEQLAQSREARRKAVLEIMKQSLNHQKSKSGSVTNFRRQF